MNEAVTHLDFEMAAILRDKIRELHGTPRVRKSVIRKLKIR